MNKSPIGIFDSGFGGLTVFKEIEKSLPQYDYVYLGDNARVPYGNRSFETVYQYTKECVFQLFDLGCNLVILACNTASAKALRTIQQNDLPNGKKVLGVIRPTSEVIDQYTKSGNVGILATEGTVNSKSYELEIKKFFPEIKVFQHACPVWVPIVETNDLDSPGTDYYVERDVKKLLAKSLQIDTILLACTHYPLLLPVIQKFVSADIQIISQGTLVADSLKDYLNRHPEIEIICSKNGTREFYCTDRPEYFEKKATIFYGKTISAKKLSVSISE